MCVIGKDCGGAIPSYRLVKPGASAGLVVVATAATDKVIGVSGHVIAADGTDGYNSGDRADIHIDDICFVTLGGTAVEGDSVVSDSQGRAVAVTGHTHTENAAGTYTQSATTGAASIRYAAGYLLEGGVVGDVVKMLLSRHTI